MATVWRNIIILGFAHFVVSQNSHCGKPTQYADRRLDDRYLPTSEYMDGEKVAYRCAPGYAQTGGSRVSFCEKGRWTPLNLTCGKKKCSPLRDIENGRYRQEGRLFGDTATAVCKNGYVVKGDRIRVCGEEGWNGTDPVCEISRECPAPDLGKNGTVSHSKASYAQGDNVTVTCITGHSGSGVFTCNGRKWHPHAPKCRMVKCPEIIISRGSVSTRRVRYNTSVVVSCDPGFSLHGASHLHCAANSSWTPEVPKCEPGNCGPAPLYPLAHPRDEYFLQKEHTSGARVRYKCTIGFRWSGGSDIIYCKDGQWTELQLQCERKKCGSAGEIFNGRFEYTGVSFGDSATVVCDEGYELIGPAVRYCRDGGWDGRNAECEPVHCPPPTAVNNALTSDLTYDHVPFGHVVSYRCRTGTLIGAREIHCTEKGTWSAPPPECRDVICPVPKVPHGSRMSSYRPAYRVGNTVAVTCNPGFRLSGDRHITCRLDGEWNPELSSMCVQVSNAHHYRQ